ncbi:MAG: pentapeptide repeat-containing protein [Planctomycetota bacterium]|jgi:hypothetical protein
MAESFIIPELVVASGKKRVLPLVDRAGWLGATLALVLSVAFASSTALAEDAPPVSFRCAFRITTDRTVEPPAGATAPSAPDNPSVTTHAATGVLVERRTGGTSRYFLVTAYHVIYKTKSVELTALNRTTGLDTAGLLQDFYFDLAADLAVFELTRATIDGGGFTTSDKYHLARRSVREIAEQEGIVPEAVDTEKVVKRLQDLGIAVSSTEVGEIREEKVAVAIDLHPEPRPQRLVGLPATVVGNPLVETNRPENICYGATVSEVASLKDRVPGVVKGAGQVTNQEALKKARERDFLFLETLSVNKGFSGGPVLVPHDVEGAGGSFAVESLAGVILGGDPEVRAGRYAWACPPRAIENGIQVLEGTATVPSGEEGIRGTRSYQRMGRDPSHEWPDTLFDLGQTYGFASVVLVARPQDLVRHSKRMKCTEKDWELVREEVRADPGEPDTMHSIEFVFDGITFEGVDFSNADLTNAKFINCVFQDAKLGPGAGGEGKLRFGGTVLNGVVFRDCLFSVPELPNADKRSIGQHYGRPAMAFGVKIQNCYVTTRRDTETEPFRGGHAARLVGSSKAAEPELAEPELAEPKLAQPEGISEPVTIAYKIMELDVGEIRVEGAGEPLLIEHLVLTGETKDGLVITESPFPNLLAP